MLIEFDETIEAAASEVWLLLTDPDSVREWSGDVEDIVPHGDTQHIVGAVSSVHIRERGKVHEYREEIREIDEGRLIELSLSGGNLGKNSMVVRYELITVEPQITTLVYRSEWAPSGWMRFIAPLISKAATKGAVGSIKNLKALAE